MTSEFHGIACFAPVQGEEKLCILRVARPTSLQTRWLKLKAYRQAR